MVSKGRLAVVIVFLSCVSIYVNIALREVWWNTDHASTDHNNSRCPSSLSYVYVKTHKTGSTTLRNILWRLHGLNASHTRIQLYPRPFAGGYPGSFRKDLTITNGNAKSRVDVLSAHIRFNETAVREIMNPKAKYITIMRNPKKQFQSSFNFYYARYGKNVGSSKKITCHGSPYLQVTGKASTPLSQYLQLAEAKLDRTYPWYFRSQNYQAYDLGLDPTKISRHYVLNEAKRLDSIFDLVLIFEYLLESLVLLKNIFCMDWEDIIPDDSTSKPYHCHARSENDERIIRKLTFQDQILYDYFNASLWQKIQSYGKNEMARDVQRLKLLIVAKQSRKNAQANAEIVASYKTETQLKLNAQIPTISRDTRANRIFHMMQSKHRTIAKPIARYMSRNWGWCPH